MIENIQKMVEKCVYDITKNFFINKFIPKKNSISLGLWGKRSCIASFLPCYSYLYYLPKIDDINVQRIRLIAAKPGTGYHSTWYLFAFISMCNCLYTKDQLYKSDLLLFFLPHMVNMWRNFSRDFIPKMISLVKLFFYLQSGKGMKELILGECL